MTTFYTISWRFILSIEIVSMITIWTHEIVRSILLLLTYLRLLNWHCFRIWLPIELWLFKVVLSTFQILWVNITTLLVKLTTNSFWWIKASKIFNFVQNFTKWTFPYGYFLNWFFFNLFLFYVFLRQFKLSMVILINNFFHIYLWFSRWTKRFTSFFFIIVYLRFIFHSRIFIF